MAMRLVTTTLKEMMIACSMGESMEKRYLIPRTPQDLRCPSQTTMEAATDNI